MSREKINQEEIAEGIRRANKLRKEAEAGSVSAIAKYTGISRQTLYRWKKGGWNPSLEKIEAIQNWDEDERMEGFRRRGRPLGSKTKNKSAIGKIKPLNRARNKLITAIGEVLYHAKPLGLTLAQVLQGKYNSN